MSKTWVTLSFLMMNMCSVVCSFYMWASFSGFQFHPGSDLIKDMFTWNIRHLVLHFPVCMTTVSRSICVQSWLHFSPPQSFSLKTKNVQTSAWGVNRPHCFQDSTRQRMSRFLKIVVRLLKPLKGRLCLHVHKMWGQTPGHWHALQLSLSLSHFDIQQVSVLKTTEQLHYQDQKREWAFEGNTVTPWRQVKEGHRNVVWRDSCDFTALMALLGYNKKLRVRPCELTQTAETGCSWELPVPFRIFFAPRFWMLRSACNGRSVLWRTETSLSAGQQLVFFVKPVSSEKTCVTTGSLWKYSWSSTTGTALGSALRWLNGEPTQLSGVSRLLEMEI